jgi:adenosylhomocysteine nucleosidase
VTGGGDNIGAINNGSGTVNMGSAQVIGTQNNASAPRPGAEAGRRASPPADVGVLTVLPVETRAVVDVLQRHAGYGTDSLPGGAQAFEARIGPPGAEIRVVAIQSLSPGPYSASEGYRRLRQWYAPPVLLLVGIAGGIHPDVAVGDVVIGTQVIYYDARKETVAGPVRRGETKPVTAALGHRLNDFMRGGQHVGVGPGRTVTVHCGPIGSGSAVVAYAEADLRRFLAGFNDKTLAVETEAAGFAQAFYEEEGNQADGPRGWLTVRGISDLADAAKHDGGHELAARNAAAVLERLVPYLVVPPPY